MISFFRMISLSYSISSILKETLQEVEIKRKRIVLQPLSPTNELRYRWDAMLERIYSSLALSGIGLKKQEIATIITKQQKTPHPKIEYEVLRYKKALDYIDYEWLVTEKVLTHKGLLSLHTLACPGKLRVKETELHALLDYVQMSPDNPILQAGIVQLEVYAMRPFTDGNGRLARLLTLLFLYKNGYNVRGLLTIESYWLANRTYYQDMLNKTIASGNCTLWLEFFTHMVLDDLDKIEIKLRTKQSLERDHIWVLTERQKEILAMVAEPGSSLTNRKVQKTFAISQITASRDLSKLATLGLLYSRGKGRSVYYTRT